MEAQRGIIAERVGPVLVECRGETVGEAHGQDVADLLGPADPGLEVFDVDVHGIPERCRRHVLTPY